MCLQYVQYCHPTIASKSGHRSLAALDVEEWIGPGMSRRSLRSWKSWVFPTPQGEKLRIDEHS